ncbi:MAG: hypothetical protein JO143_03790 [Acetobacteraceae bacterium]|nr:hypothetical protein [Acetobacteraceae bacterium]
MKMTFDIESAADLFERVLLPTYQDFLSNNASTCYALQATLVAYHLFDWANNEGFTDEASFIRHHPEPEYREMVKYFEIARGLANGFKHFGSPLPGKQHTGARVVTSTQVGFGSPFSDEFCRPLNAEDISIDILLRKLVTFWTAQHRKGALRQYP